MIAKLRGLIDEVGKDFAVVDVHGVGYLVFCPARTLAALPAVGEAASLHVETHVREDHIHLYGFATAAERSWFRLLTTVQGVGSRVAMGLLSVLGPQQLVECVVAQDKQPLLRADGVGPKLAARIVAELRDRVSGLEMGGTMPAAALAGDGLDQAAADAISGLVNLGYGRAEAFAAVSRVAQGLGDAASAEALIPAALKALSA